MLAEQRVCSKGKRQCQLGKREIGFLREELGAQVVRIKQLRLCHELKSCRYGAALKKL